MTSKAALLRAPDPMPPGRIELEGATLEIGHCALVPPKLRTKLREIVGLFVSPGARRKGRATALLDEVCGQADQHGIVLVLTVIADPFSDSPGLAPAALVDWYARAFGFRILPGTGGAVVMAREPRAAVMPAPTVIASALSQAMH